MNQWLPSYGDCFDNFSQSSDRGSSQLDAHMTKTVVQDHAIKIISPELGPATPTTAPTFKFPEETIIIKHEVPRLGGESCACDFRDADGLRRIVETQAADLVRLRRALLSALSRPPQPTRSTQDVEIYEWVRSTLFAELARVQDAIASVIERSRWRHLGLRLGLAKQSGWESGGWRTELIRTSDDTKPDGGVGAISAPKLLDELGRLSELLDTFRKSRWWRLGQRLGLAERFPWESDLWNPSLLMNPAVAEEKPSPASANDRSVDVKSTAFHPSHDGLIEFRFLKECREFATDVILDIGANTGLFGESVRRLGYRGHLVSFEPLSQPHAALIATASVDPLWDVVERCAVGASEGSAKINIAGNSYSSSLLPMLDRHREAAPGTEYRGTQRCPVITLDAFIERTFSDPTTLFGLKISTQGYQADVLAGLKRNHDRVKVILCEMSILPLYAHAPLMGEVCHLLAELNYRCVALSPVFWDRRNGELLQVDGIFVKQA